MGHLIGAIRGGDVRTSRKDLVAVHDYLVENARLALGRALREPAEAFGAGVKRQQVELAAVRRPTLVQAGERHNLMEVVNQCATLERLLDALAWIERTPRFDGAVIQVCHPSTSSDPDDEARPDNDLVLRLPDGALARFEVSDVVTDRDGNGKEVKDLRSLGVVGLQRAPVLAAEVWPSALLFLIVSKEFASRLVKPTRHVLKSGWCHFGEAGSENGTRVIEIHRGHKEK